MKTIMKNVDLKTFWRFEAQKTISQSFVHEKRD